MEKVAIADQIIQRQDKDGMLRRALERIIQLYTDKSHFVYELLQNAEDTGASKIKFEQYPDRLEVFHDGHPFTLDNLQGLCDIGKSDKIEDLNQIGEFGVGFKSVFAICETVRLYSHPRADEEAEYDQYAVEIKDFTHPVEIEDQDMDTAYTTKFVFPYSVGHTFSGFDSLGQLNHVLSKRLQDIGITTLLFMKNLQAIDYKIELPNLQASGAYVLNKTHLNDHCALISAKGNQAANKGSEEIAYLVFSRAVSGIQGERTIDIAFAVTVEENGEYFFETSKHPYISVYFPTETESKLKFIVQGPYRTTPNRSSVPAEDKDNIDLAKQTARLLRDSVLELRDSGKLNYSFLNILPFDDSVFNNARLFECMFSTVKSMMLEENLLLCKDGTYASADSVKISRGTDFAEILSDNLLTELLNDGTQYHWLPTFLTETNRTYETLYRFLTSVLNIEMLRPEILRNAINNNDTFMPNRDNEWLVKFYNMYDSVGGAFVKKKGGTNMLTAKFIKTSKGTFVAPYRKSVESEQSSAHERENKSSAYIPNVFLPIEDMDWVEDIAFVDEEIFQRCRHFFTDILNLQKPDQYEFFNKDFIRRYERRSDISKEQYIKDLKNLLYYLNNDNYRDEVRNLIKKYIEVRCYKDGEIVNVNPSNEKVYLPVTTDGMSIEQYYAHIAIYPYIDVDFYEEEGIDTEMLKLLGISEEVAIGLDETTGDYTAGKSAHLTTWKTVEKFRWKLSLDKLDDVLKYISNNPSAPDSMAKSSFIFRFLQNHENMLTGTVYIQGRYANLNGAYSEIVKKLRRDDLRIVGEDTIIQTGKWLFTNTNELVYPRQITKYDLNTQLYGEIKPESKLYEILGFSEGADEQKEAIIKEYDRLDENTKEQFFEIALQQKFGISPLDLEENLTFASNIAASTHSDQENFEFPSVRVKNWDYLKRHAVEELVFANPVRYQDKVLRYRVSRSDKEIKAYLQSMYKLEGRYDYVCQMCHQPVRSHETCQLSSSMEEELNSMYLCMCPNCAAEYRRMIKNEDSLQEFLDKIMNLNKEDIDASDPVKIDFKDKSIWFTQTHIAEIKELMTLKCERDKNNSLKKDSISTYTKNEEVADLDTEEVIAEPNSYEELVGEKVFHKRAGHGIVKECDGEHISIEFEDGEYAGEVKKYSYNSCMMNDLLKFN